MHTSLLLLLQLLLLPVRFISARTMVGCMVEDNCLHFYNETITRGDHVTRCMAHGQNVAEIEDLATYQMIKDSGHSGLAWLTVEFTENSQWTYVNGTTIDTAPESVRPTESTHCATIFIQDRSTPVVRSTLCNQDYGYICQRPTSGSQTSCDFMSDDNNTCYSVGNQSVNWYAARYQCSTLYAADLVLAEDHTLYNKAHGVRPFARYWVGLYNGSWTIPGSGSQAPIYTNWAKNQPNNSLHCAVVDLSTGCWSTVNCSSSNQGYMCQTGYPEPLTTPDLSDPSSDSPLSTSLGPTNDTSTILLLAVVGCLAFLLLLTLLFLLLYCCWWKKRQKEADGIPAKSSELSETSPGRGGIPLTSNNITGDVPNGDTKAKESNMVDNVVYVSSANDNRDDLCGLGNIYSHISDIQPKPETKAKVDNASANDNCDDLSGLDHVYSRISDIQPDLETKATELNMVDNEVYVSSANDDRDDLSGLGNTYSRISDVQPKPDTKATETNMVDNEVYVSSANDDRDDLTSLGNIHSRVPDVQPAP